MGGCTVQAYLLVALLFLLAIIIFVFQNTSLVIVHFLSWTSSEVSLAVVILIAAFAGAIVTFLLNTIRYFKVGKKLRELAAVNQGLQNEIDKLKAQRAKEFSQEKSQDTTGKSGVEK